MNTQNATDTKPAPQSSWLNAPREGFTAAQLRPRDGVV
jgi:hypothetical protein